MTLQSQMSVPSTAWNHHPSSFIFLPSSFFIHPSSLFIIIHSSFLHFATFKPFRLVLYHFYWLLCKFFLSIFWVKFWFVLVAGTIGPLIFLVCIVKISIIMDIVKGRLYWLELHSIHFVDDCTNVIKANDKDQLEDVLQLCSAEHHPNFTELEWSRTWQRKNTLIMLHLLPEEQNQE